MLSRYPIVLAFSAVALVIAARRALQLAQLVAGGTGPSAGDRHGRLARRSRREVTEVLGQRKLLRWTVPGLSHAAVFWGFVVLLLTIIEAVGALFLPTFSIPGIGHSPVVGLLEDVSALAVLFGIAAFAVQRIRQPPTERESRFYGSHTKAAWIVLALITAVIVTLMLYRAAQVNTGHFPFGHAAFFSHGLARILRPLGLAANQRLETIFVDLNVIVIVGFLAYLVHSKHLHIFLAPINIAYARSPRALGALGTLPDLDPEHFNDQTVIGAGQIDHFNWKQLLDLVTCTECGRCQTVCPAWTTEKPLSPKLFVMDLREELLSRAPLLPWQRSREETAGRPLVPDVIDPSVLWACTTCGACVEECPVDIEHVDAILDIRRYEVMMESRFPSGADRMLRNIESVGDPFGLGKNARLDWTNALDFPVVVIEDEIPEEVDYLFWVGCAGAFDDRARRTTQSLARLLHEAEIPFAVLGPRESCVGDPARRFGNEYLFQNQANEVIGTLNAAKAHKIVASCPHCLNTIANEFPALGGNYEVVHHSVLLAELLRSGRLRAGETNRRTTFHDPCYLGRHNRVFDEPRDVIDTTGSTRIEMGRSREKSFCCGAGGAHMWFEEQGGRPINLERIDEALRTGAEVIATACPYCRIMLDDTLRTRERQNEIEVLDLAQLLESSIQHRGPSTSP